MKDTEFENKIPCIVEYGIIYSKRDMIRILRDLDHVEYLDLIDNVTVARGEGYVVEVFANSFDSTIVFNNRLHINVNSFDFLKVRSEPEKLVELISGHRTVRLRPLTNVLALNKSAIEEDIDEQRLAITNQLACDNEVDLDYPVD